MTTQARVLTQVFPELRGRVAGENYPPPASRVMVGRVATVVAAAVAAIAVFGDTIFAAVGASRPDWATWL